MKKLLLVIMAVSLSACATNSTDQLLATDASQVALRSIQTRYFETQDKSKLLRVAIATLQDLSFVIDKADDTLGSISATKLDGYALRMSITVRPKDKTSMIVRANAQYNLTAVSDPVPYQQFFDAYSKALFLEAHLVE